VGNEAGFYLTGKAQPLAGVDAYQQSINAVRSWTIAANNKFLSQVEA
jgi:hypothetical protein